MSKIETWTGGFKLNIAPTKAIEETPKNPSVPNTAKKAKDKISAIITLVNSKTPWCLSSRLSTLILMRVPVENDNTAEINPVPELVSNDSVNHPI